MSVSVRKMINLFTDENMDTECVIEYVSVLRFRQTYLNVLISDYNYVRRPQHLPTTKAK